MKKTKSIFKASVYEESKAKLKKVKPVKNKTFTTGVVEIKEDSPDKIIGRQIAEMKKQKDEQLLLEAELEKPFKKRDQTLMQKYGYKDGVNNVDAYPVLNGEQKYRVTIYIPEDSAVRAELRPNPWYVKLEVKYDGNEFIFRFPLSRSNVSADETVYQLDGFPVWVDSEGMLIDDISQYSLYQALHDWIHKIERNDDLILKIFTEYGIASSTGNVWKIPLDFCVRGKGFGVSFTKIRASTTTAATTAATTATTTTSTPAQFTAFNIYETLNYHGGNKSLAEFLIKNATNKNSERVFLGLDPNVKFARKNLILEHVVMNTRFSDNATYYMLTGYDNDGKNFEFAIINGVHALHQKFPHLKRSRKVIEDAISEQNINVYNAGINNQQVDSIF